LAGSEERTPQFDERVARRTTKRRPEG
jgi:hypothetical protein